MLKISQINISQKNVIRQEMLLPGGGEINLFDERLWGHMIIVHGQIIYDKYLNIL